MSPAWLLDIPAALMLLVAAVSAARLAICSPPRGAHGADADIAHLLMGIAMAGMLAPGVTTLPPFAWAAIFGLLAAWFAWRLACDILAGDIRVNGLRSLVRGHRAAHLLHCAAMVYMLAALTASNGIDMTAICSSTTRSLPALALAFAFVLVCQSGWDVLGQLSARRYRLGVAPSSRIAMGVTMAIMLITS